MRLGSMISWFSDQTAKQPQTKKATATPAVTVSNNILLESKEPSDAPIGLFGRIQVKNESVSLDLDKFKAPGECQLPIESNHSEIGRVFLTKNDGSCGLHGLFGEYNSKEATFILGNVGQKREEIANWIENSFETGNPSPLILESLQSYINNPDEAPSYVKSMINYIKTNEISDRIENILNKPGLDFSNKSLTTENPLLRAAFVRHIREVSSYLSFEEVGAIAIQYNKKITIYTKFDNQLIETDSYGNDQIPSVCLCSVCLCFDSEKRHFTKMLIKAPGQELEETPDRFQVNIETDLEKEQKNLAYALKYSEPSPRQDSLESDLLLAESLLRQFEQEEKQRIAQEEADFKLAQSLEANPLSKEDFEAFYDQSINNIKKTNSSCGIPISYYTKPVLGYHGSLINDEEIPSNLKEVIEQHTAYIQSLNKNYTFSAKPILKSREWREAYIEHLVSGNNLSKADLNLIEEMKKRKKNTEEEANFKSTQSLQANPIESSPKADLSSNAFTLKNKDSSDPRFAESLQRQLAKEEEQKIAQEQVDFKPVQSLELKLESKEDLEAFYDSSLSSKKPFLFSVAILNYYSDLRRGIEIPLNLKEVIIKSQEYKKSLQFPLEQFDFRGRSILQSSEWKEAYIEHLVSGKNLSQADLNVIKQVKKRKIEVFYSWENIDNRRMLIAALRHNINSLKVGKSIPEKLKEIILNPEYTSLAPFSKSRTHLNVKKIAQSSEWKEAYIEHIISGLDLSQADLDVLRKARALSLG